ncbi:MAG: hypothetical protein ABJF10_18430 [Chthoniobacter sp.]|uniref:hypothetical protein n=1 Tax=Chthoniobacter sp. TaxID=2510640 RepID=UPI0032A5B0E2
MKVLPVLFLAVVALWSCAAVATAAPPVELLTATEAAQPNLPIGKEKPDGAPVPLAHSETKPVVGAPQIVVETPTQGVGVSAPFPVIIRFVPSTGAKINLESLRVEVLKLIPISLLSKVKPYLSPTGINVPEAKIPAGTYNVRIAVADDQGREGSTVQMWTVR